MNVPAAGVCSIAALRPLCAEPLAGMCRCGRAGPAGWGAPQESRRGPLHRGASKGGAAEGSTQKARSRPGEQGALEESYSWETEGKSEVKEGE